MQTFTGDPLVGSKEVEGRRMRDPGRVMPKDALRRPYGTGAHVKLSDRVIEPPNFGAPVCPVAASPPRPPEPTLASAALGAPPHARPTPGPRPGAQVAGSSQAEAVVADVYGVPQWTHKPAIGPHRDHLDHTREAQAETNPRCDPARLSTGRRVLLPLALCVNPQSGPGVTD